MDSSPMETFDFHHSMLSDQARVHEFLRAVVAAVNPGDIVVDIGSGTGLLAFFAARAGAERVYAIESGPVIDLAREVAARNGLGDRVVFLPGASTEVELPEPADVVVSETIGNAAFDEGIVAWLDDARRRFLKPSGRVVPEQVRLMASLVHLPGTYAAAERWQQPLAGMDFSPLAAIALRNLQWVELSPASLVTAPAALAVARFDRGPVLSQRSAALEGRLRVSASESSRVHGIGVWFDASLVDGVSLTNAPPNAVPSWDQGMLPLEHPIDLAAGQEVELSVRVSADGREWAWAVDLPAE